MVKALSKTLSPPAAGLLLVLATGFLMRLYACWATVIIPPDGALYLYQAKMVLNGQWEKVTGCGLTFLSNLPLLIAGAYTVVPDWETAAQIVSVFFGTGTLIWIYLTLREYCDAAVSATATLIPALTPVMVSRSADVVREPVFWFFLSLGLYLFTLQARKSRYALYLAGSQLAFLMALWARIEGILVFPVSLVVLACHYREDRFRRLAAFLAPLMLLILCLATLFAATGKDLSVHLRGGEIVAKATAVADQYDLLRDQLKAAVAADTREPLKWFLPEARSNVWLVGLGVVVNRIAEGFFYPYLIVYLLGAATLKRRLGTDRRLIYPVLLIVASLLLFYFYVLETWVLHYRMIILALIPSTIAAAFGIELLRDRLCRRFKLSPRTVLIGLGLLVLLAGLPKNLAPRDPDKAVFREIGSRIAAMQNDAAGVKIFTSAPLHRWVSFYANIDAADPPCPQHHRHNTWSRRDADLKRLVRRLRRSGTGYFLWDEKHWPDDTFRPDHPLILRHLEPVGQWTHPDTGRMMLFKVKADLP